MLHTDDALGTKGGDIVRAEQVEAMERTEALMREARKPGHNFGHSIVLPVVGLMVAAAIFGLVAMGESLSVCGISLGGLLVLAVVSFIRDRSGR